MLADYSWFSAEETSGLASRKMGLYRVDPRAGVPQRIFDIEGFAVFSCSNKAAALCVFGRPSADKSEPLVASFDPLGSPGKERYGFRWKRPVVPTLDSTTGGVDNQQLLSRYWPGPKLLPRPR
jgi:hypothetical protein